MTSVSDRLTVDLPVLGRVDPAWDRQAVVDHLRTAARAVRRRDIVMIHNTGQGHIGGDFSVIDVLVTLYLAAARYDPADPDDPERDRIILSKGHASGALYTTMATLGLIDPAELSSYMAPQSMLNGHPDRTKVRGVEANTGPLGHGLPIAVGTAIAGKLDGSDRRTFVIVGDGELQEGSNWEAMMTAGTKHLDHLVAVADRNHLQQGASTEDTNDLEPLADKARAFGWHVVEVDGHDHGAFLDVFAAVPEVRGRPTFVIAHTHKGHPISFMSDDVAWHHKVPTTEQVLAALTELEEL